MSINNRSKTSCHNRLCKTTPRIKSNKFLFFFSLFFFFSLYLFSPFLFYLAQQSEEQLLNLTTLQNHFSTAAIRMAQTPTPEQLQKFLFQVISFLSSFLLFSSLYFPQWHHQTQIKNKKDWSNPSKTKR